MFTSRAQTRVRYNILRFVYYEYICIYRERRYINITNKYPPLLESIFSFLNDTILLCFRFWGDWITFYNATFIYFFVYYFYVRIFTEYYRLEGDQPIVVHSMKIRGSVVLELFFLCDRQFYISIIIFFSTKYNVYFTFYAEFKMSNSIASTETNWLVCKELALRIANDEEVQQEAAIVGKRFREGITKALRCHKKNVLALNGDCVEK